MVRGLFGSVKGILICLAIIIWLVFSVAFMTANFPVFITGVTMGTQSYKYLTSEELVANRPLNGRIHDVTADVTNYYSEYIPHLKINCITESNNIYLVPIDEAVVLKKFGERYAKKVEDVIPLNNNSLLVFFRNGEVKRCDINNLKKDDRFFKPVLASKALFDRVSVQTGGYSIYWGENAVIPDSVLYDIGINIPLCMDDFISFLANRVISTAEAAKLLNCTRQNISDLVARDKLHPVKTEDKIKFFLKSEIMQRMWK